MCAPAEGQRGTQKDYFDPAVKCCTYIPVLHNFLVGRILSDDDAASRLGRSTVEARIKDGVAVTPLGLGRPPMFSVIYEASTNGFGRSRNLRCPHYIEDGGRCGVWRHRESTCVTWFCKHVRGEVGFNFWRKALHQLLLSVENELARWCVLELNLDLDALRRLVSSADHKSDSLTSEAVDNRVDRSFYKQIWGTWLGREVEFFNECARLVDPLTWKDVLSICGPEARMYARLTQDAYEKLSTDEMPPALKSGSMQLVQIGRETTRVSTYSAFDPIDVPSAVMDSLRYFDGRPTEEAMAAIASGMDISLDHSLLRKMVDFALLVPVEGKDQLP